MPVEIRQMGPRWSIEVEGQAVGSAFTEAEARELAEQWDKKLMSLAPGGETPWRIEARAEELEIWVHDRLRTMELYGRLQSIVIQTTRIHPAGWTAVVTGDFTVEERRAIRAL